MDEPTRRRSNGTESKDISEVLRERNRVIRQTVDRASDEYDIAKARLTEKRANCKRELRQWEEIGGINQHKSVDKHVKWNKLEGYTK